MRDTDSKCEGASNAFIYKGYSSILDSTLCVAIANESETTLALAITLFLTEGRLSDSFVLEMDKADIESAKEAGTLVNSIEQGYLEMLQEEKSTELAYHANCNPPCHLVH